MKEMMKRPARKQIKEFKHYTPVNSGDYNIWYHRYSGYEYRETRRDRGTLTRCNLERDAGKTRADKNAPLCIHFALGNCAKGHECMYRHTIPTDADERRVGITHDVFGRERFKTDRDDMGGVGSFSRENRTLYIGGLKPEIPVRTYEQIMRKHFGEWGDLEYVRVLPVRGIGFVRYRLRTAAEFAKVAMADQSLDDEESINVRWAHPDPNPVAKAVDEQAEQAKFLKAVERSIMPQAAIPPPPPSDDEDDDNSDNEDMSEKNSKNKECAINDDNGDQQQPPTKVQALSLPTVGYKYVFANTGRLPVPPPPDVTQAAPTSGSAADAADRVQEKARLQNVTGGKGKYWENYVPNPDTGEFHPYSYGLIYPRQAAERPKESNLERGIRLEAISKLSEKVSERVHQQEEEQLTQAKQQKQKQIEEQKRQAELEDEPGYHNDQPLF